MQPNLNEVTILPYVQVADEWTVPDATIIGLHAKLEQDGTFRHVFYDGEIKTADDLLRMLKNPVNVPSFVLVNGYVRGIAWLNSLQSNHATAHFCVFKEAWGSASVDMGKEMLKYWFSFKRDDGSPRFDLILGVTPAHYVKALRFIKQIGFALIGELPHILYDGYDNKRVAAVLSYCERPQHG